MADLERTAEATWHGDLRGGSGRFSAASGILKEASYSFATRFENAPGTNPEELLAAAESACYSMAFANNLSKKGFTVNEINTRATCVLSPQATGGFKITKMRLVTRGKVEGIDSETFKAVAKETSTGCPVSVALSAIAIEVEAQLV